jgi:hypothetical protein
MSPSSSSTAEAADDALATPTSDAAAQRRAAREFASRVGASRNEKGAPVRTVFAADPSVERTPLARLMSGDNGPGGGRGGQVRLKLLISLYWVCVAEPYDFIAPARAWAALIGLDDHGSKGVRRIHQAVADLEERKFISVEDRGGHPSRITLLSEEGDGSAYEPATNAYNQAKASNASAAVLARHQYFRIPSTVWTAGHIARLTGPALALMLVLLAEQRGKPDEVWFSPSRAEERFGLAPTTITKGLRTLKDLGLVQTRRKAVSEQGTYIGFTRYRNVHALSITDQPPRATATTSRSRTSLFDLGGANFDDLLAGSKTLDQIRDEKRSGA